MNIIKSHHIINNPHLITCFDEIKEQTILYMARSIGEKMLECNLLNIKTERIVGGHFETEHNTLSQREIITAEAFLLSLKEVSEMRKLFKSIINDPKIPEHLKENIDKLYSIFIDGILT